MKILVFLIGIAALVLAILVYYIAAAKTHSAIHEIEALLLLLVAVVAVSAASIMQRMDDAADSRDRAAEWWLKKGQKGGAP